jgi:predicted MarR family transcription regulator
MTMEEKYYKNWHLARNTMQFSVTEFEWAMIRFYEAFSRYVLANGMVTIDPTLDLKYQEHVILHVIRMMDRPKTGATIARLINRDDIPNIQYSLRKLESAGLIEKQKEGNGKTFSYKTTPKGTQLTDEYYKIKAEILFRRMEDINEVVEKFGDATRFMSLLTGIYEEAARESSTFTPQTPD